jgi:AcrR family transcriptional regulator
MMGRKSRADERREQIVWALFDCLAENGHETVTIKAIAEQAGLPHGVIHYYFKSKDDIIISLISSMVGKYEMLLDSLREITFPESLGIDQILDFCSNVLIFDNRLNRVFYNLIQLSFERKNLNEALFSMLEVYRRRIAETVFGGLDENEARKMSIAALALIEGLALQWMNNPDSLDSETARNILKKVFLNL